jgi:hypothetical protein
LQTPLLHGHSGPTGAGDSGVFDHQGGKQLLTDLTTIKGLALGQSNQSSGGSAHDPNHVTGVGTFGQLDLPNGQTHIPPGHDH